MKTKPSSILTVAGINCHYYAQDGVTRLPAVAAFVTEDSMRATRRKKAEGDKQINVNYGDLIVIRTTPSGGKDAVIQPLGKHGAYFIDIMTDKGPKPLRFTGAGMLSAREALSNMSETGNDMGADGRNVLSAVSFIFDLASANPDIKRYSGRVVADAFLSVMSEGASAIELSITHEEFARKACGDLIRAEIGMVEPAHKDALMRSMDLDKILAESGAKVLTSSGNPERGIRGDDEGDPRNVVMAGQQLSKEVLDRITSTPADVVSVSIVDASSAGSLMEEMEDRALSGPWVSAAEKGLQELLGKAMPGVAYDFMLAAKEGRDLMIVSEANPGSEGSIFIYSWPSSDRYPAMDIDGTITMTISPEEIPDFGEISRLSGVLEKMNDLALTDGLQNFA
ncbi:MAG: hypothetical protein ABJN42_02990 [Roseibium sp.]|uniref:hypothetical protein n=1 Tax=Roseibium sp. TaxID=1936156 RepID=UPI003298C0E3